MESRQPHSHYPSRLATFQPQTSASGGPTQILDLAATTSSTGSNDGVDRETSWIELQTMPFEEAKVRPIRGQILRNYMLSAACLERISYEINDRFVVDAVP